MLNDDFRRLLFSTNFYELLGGCFYFLTYKFNIMGWHISIVNTIVFTECFELIMDKIAVMFGKTEVQDAAE